MVLFHAEILCQPALFINKIDPHHFDHGLHTHNSLGLCDGFVPRPMFWHFVSGSYSNFQDLSQVTVKLRYVNWFQRFDWHLLKIWLSSYCPTARTCGTKFEQTILSNLHEESDAVSPSWCWSSTNFKGHLMVSGHKFTHFCLSGYQAVLASYSNSSYPSLNLQPAEDRCMKYSSFPNTAHDFLQLFSQV